MASEPAFDISFEDDILALCIRDEAYLKKAIRICDAHHFSGRERSWVWKVISDTWHKFRERPNGRLIAVRAKEDFVDEDKRKPYLSLSLKLLKHRPASPASALEELGKFVRHVNLQLAIEKSVEALEKGKLEDAEEAIRESSRKFVGERNYTHVSWIEGFEDRQEARRHEREHPEEFTVIPTGLKRLDKVLAGGARKGELGLIMGTTGRGKSVGLSNFAYSAIKHKFPTAYFALEMPARQVAMRADALWSQFEYNQFKNFDFKPSELRLLDAKLKRSAKRFANLFHIISMPVKSADMRSIRAALDDLKEEYGFSPSMICMDSGDHLKHTDKSLDSYRLQQAEVYWQLKQLAEEDGYVIWSSVHAGKEWAHQIATAEATSESYDKARIADLILSIYDPNSRPERRRKTVVHDDDDKDEPEEIRDDEGDVARKTRRLQLYLAKYRDGASLLKFDIEADLARMTLKELGGEDDATE